MDGITDIHFNEGQKYHLPYAWPVHSGAYIGYGVSVDGHLMEVTHSYSRL